MSATRRQPGPSKNDVAMAQIEAKRSIREMYAYGITRAACVALSFLPLYALSQIAEPFAGSTTRLDINLALGITVALSFTVNVGFTVKWRSQRVDLQRLRQRQRELEHEVEVIDI